MQRFELDLRLDVAAPESDDEPVELSGESQRVRARIYKQLGLKAHSGKAWVTLDLESVRGWSVVQKLVEECRSGLVVVGSATARLHLFRVESHLPAAEARFIRQEVNRNR